MAFIMERDLEGPGANTASALRAIAGALPAVEIVDSRVADWKIKLVDTVADNASSGLIVMEVAFAVSTSSTFDSSAWPSAEAAS
jgi:2-keto-4-pentenoate hydratase